MVLRISSIKTSSPRIRRLLSNQRSHNCKPSLPHKRHNSNSQPFRAEGRLRDCKGRRCALAFFASHFSDRQESLISCKCCALSLSLATVAEAHSCRIKRLCFASAPPESPTERR